MSPMAPLTPGEARLSDAECWRVDALYSMVDVRLALDAALAGQPGIARHFAREAAAQLAGEWDWLEKMIGPLAEARHQASAPGVPAPVVGPDGGRG